MEIIDSKICVFVKMHTDCSKYSMCVSRKADKSMFLLTITMEDSHGLTHEDKRMLL